MTHCETISTEIKFLDFLFKCFGFYGRLAYIGSVLFRFFRFQFEQLYLCRNGVSYCKYCWISCWVKFVISWLVFGFLFFAGSIALLHCHWTSLDACCIFCFYFWFHVTYCDYLWEGFLSTGGVVAAVIMCLASNFREQSIFVWKYSIS